MSVTHQKTLIRSIKEMIQEQELLVRQMVHARRMGLSRKVEALKEDLAIIDARIRAEAALLKIAGVSESQLMTEVYS